MTLREQINNDLKEAMKARDQVKLDTIRNIKSQIKVKEVSGTESKELDDDGIFKVIMALIKQRRDSAEQYRAGGRIDLAEKEETEAGYLSAYLPKQLTPAEVEELVAAAIKEVGATSAKEMGAVMKAVQPKIAGRADGKSVSEVVKRKLSGG